MKHKRWYLLGLCALAWISLLLLSANVALAAKLSSHVRAKHLMTYKAVSSSLVSPLSAPVPALILAPARALARVPNWGFPCSDVPIRRRGLQPNERIISQDWLVGNNPVVTKDTSISGAGRIFYTYSNDTEDLPQIRSLFGLMKTLGFALITPAIMLVGYQLMLGASFFRYAGALEGLSRVVLAAMAVAVSFQLVHMLVSFENDITAAIIALHSEHPFPQTVINGAIVPYRLAGDPPSSYRGIVVPMSRWGCAINDAIGVVSGAFITNTIGSIIPLVGGLAHLAGKVTSMPDLIHRAGELISALLSFLLWVQVFVRIVLLNYYLLMAPLAFGSWALPGGVGQRVVSLWSKGFFTVLFTQVVQLFILTTLPLLLPSLPQIGGDNLGIIQSMLLQFPLIMTLSVTLVVPSMLGASAGKAFGTAGSMAGGVVVAVGSVATHVG
jgi:hypothetical protein